MVQEAIRDGDLTQGAVLVVLVPAREANLAEFRDYIVESLSMGVLVPCWRCGGEAELQEIHTGGKPVYAVSCKKHHCGAYGCAHQTKKNAVAYWNTRAPILSESELKKLEETT